MSAKPLPRSVRACAILALLLGTCSGMNATTTALTLMQPPSATAPRPEKGPQSPEEERVLEALQTLHAAQTRAVRPFRGGRLATSMLLSVATMFTLVIALRLLVPAGLSRRPLVRSLSTVMMATAALRTVDGAFEFVIARNTARPALEVMRAQLALKPPEGTDAAAMTEIFNQLEPLIARAATTSSAIMTLFVAGALLGMGQYLRSARVMAAFPPPTEDAS